MTHKPDEAEWSIEPDTKSTDAWYSGLISVMVPSNIWISPESARRFASELIAAAEAQEEFNRKNNL